MDIQDYFASNESHTDVVTESTTVDAMVAENVALGMESDQRVIAKIEADSKGLVAIHTSMEEIAAIGEASIADGGMDRTAAALMNSACESHFRTCNAPMAMPSMESFGGASGRVSASTEALDTIKDFLSKVWKAIVSAVEDMKNKIRDFWNKYFDALPRMQKAAQGMKTKLDALGNDPKNKKVDISNAGALHTAKQVKNLDAAMTTLKDMAGGIKDTSVTRAACETFAVEVGKIDTESEATFVTTGHDAVDAVHLKLASMDIMISTSKHTNDKRWDDTQYGVARSDELPGGKAVFAIAGIANTGTDRAALTSKVASIAKAKVTVSSYLEKAPEVDNDATIDTLQKSVMEKILDDIIQTTGILMDYKKTLAKDEKATVEAKKAGEAFKKSAEKGDNMGSLQPVVGSIMKLYQPLSALTLGSPSSRCTYITTTMSAMMSVISKCAGEYKKD